MEIAAAILTKLIFEQNFHLRSRLNGLGEHATPTAGDFAAMIMPIYNGILERVRAQEG